MIQKKGAKLTQPNEVPFILTQPYELPFILNLGAVKDKRIF